MLEFIPDNLCSRVAMRTLMAGDVARRSVNFAGEINQRIAPDTLAAKAASYPAGSLARDIYVGASYGAMVQLPLGCAFGTGRHRRGPVEDVSGGYWARVWRDWNAAFDQTQAGVATQRGYLAGLVCSPVSSFPDCGISGVTASAAFIASAAVGAAVGVTFGAAVDAAGDCIARALRDPEAPAVDTFDDAAYFGELAALYAGFGLSSTFGVLPWLAHELVVRTAAVGGITTVGAGVGALVGAVGHGVGSMAGRPQPAPRDIEAGREPEAEAPLLVSVRA